MDRKEYYQSLRDRWREAKELSKDEENQIKAIILTHGMSISVTGFKVVSKQLKEQGLEGLPYIDAKTYKGWKENGFQVLKGEKSTISGVTWLEVKGKDSEDEGNNFIMPKEYKLFHRTQVDAC